MMANNFQNITASFLKFKKSYYNNRNKINNNDLFLYNFI